MADDDGMMFNFAVIQPTRPPTNQPKKPKYTKNNNDQTVDSDTKQTKKRKQTEGADEGGGKLKKKRQFKTPYIPDDKFTPISSLFNKNPSVPQLEPTPEATTSAVDVALFSSDDVKSMDIHPHLTGNLVNTLKFHKLTTVQRLSLPHLLHGRDCLVRSPTGSGKTVCYALPIVDKLMKSEPRISRSDGPYALILVPTRELALQCYEFVDKLCKSCVWVVPGLLIGGERCKAEKARLRKGVNIIVATPGRLLYHLKETACLSFHHINFLVLDEADKLLDMGFEKSILDILNTIKERSLPGEERQSVLCSATLNPRIQGLANVSLRNQMFIDATKEGGGGEMTDGGRQELDGRRWKAEAARQELGVVDFPDDDDESKPIVTNEAPEESEENEGREQMVAPSTLQQYFCIVPAKLRLVTLLSVIIDKIFLNKCSNKLIVFTLSKQSVDFHYNLLRDIVYPYCINSMNNVQAGLKEQIFKLHGDMRQQERFETFKKFKQKSSNPSILFCTDVCARGLDFPQVNWIIQYNCPAATDDYLHRVGRTARIGADGSSLLFMLPSEVKYKDVLDKHKVEIQPLEVNSLLSSLVPDNKKKQPPTQNSIEQAATQLQTVIEEKIEAAQQLMSEAKKTYLSYIRGYATYPSNVKDIFHVKHLHFGHLAKSFGLREAPTKIHEVNEIARVEKQKDATLQQKKKLMNKMKGPREEVYYRDQLLDGPLPKSFRKAASNNTPQYNQQKGKKKKLLLKR